MNMMKNYIIIILMAVFAFSSCMDEFLDVQPVSDLTVDKFWKTEDDVRTALNSAYGFLQRTYNVGYGNWYEGRSDNWAPLNSTSASNSPLATTFNQLTNQMTSSNWVFWYHVVSVANYGLHYIPQSNIADNVTKNHYIAEAYFIRAFAYFNIARIWGEAPLVLKPTLNVDDVDFPFKSTHESILRQVGEDIESALKHADIEGTLGGARTVVKTKFSAAALFALATDYYMWIGEYQKALDHSTPLRFFMNNTSIALNAINDYPKLFMPTDALSQTENIWVINWDYINQNNTINNAVWNFMAPTGPAYTFNSWFFNGTNNHAVPSLGNLPLKGWNWDAYYRGDKRKAYTLDSVAGGTSTSSPYVIANNASRVILKATGGVKPTTAMQANNFPIVIYRYADILLLRAEAYNRLGNINESVAELRKVRNRAGLTSTNAMITDASGFFTLHGPVNQTRPATNYTADGPNGSSVQLELDILKERSIELLGEGKRWFDLVRTGRAMEVMNDYYDYALTIATTTRITKYTEKSQLYWPIFYQNVIKNPNLEKEAITPD
jgi:hypothetical protein